MSRNYKYNYRTGVVYKKLINVKKTLFTVAASLGIVGAMAVPAFAASGGYCSSSLNGCTQSSAHTSCSGAGAFGASMSWVPADAQEDGGMGHETGPSNSSLCGNPQGH